MEYGVELSPIVINIIIVIMKSFMNNSKFSNETSYRVSPIKEVRFKDKQ